MKKKIIGLLTVTLVLLTVFMSSFAVYAATELKITKQPASVSAFAGDKVKVTVTAKGDGLTYKWYYKNSDQSKYTLIKNKNEKTYTVTMKEALDGRKMYCVVKDKYGKSVKTDAVKLTLKEKAKITKQPSSVIVPAGTKAKITVKATGDGLTYSWYYMNKGQNKYTLIKNKTAATYTVTMKDALSGRKMYCVVKDKYGNKVKTNVIKLTAGQAATITEQPSSVSAIAGTKAKFTVKATGDGLTYSWYYMNKGQSKYTLIKDKNTATYTVTMKDSFDGRKLYCVVKDKYGTSVKTEVVTLKLGKTAKITAQPSSAVAKKGETAVVTISATGDGLSYNWYYMNKGQSKYTLITTKKDKTYTVTMKDALNGRKMYCIVKDKYGTSVKSKVITLTMGQAVEITKQPSSVEAKCGTKASVTVTAKGDGLTYAWYYKNEGESKFTLIKDKTDKTYSVTMKGALNGRELYCVVKDKYGSSVKSDIVILYAGHVYDKGTVTKEATCKENGEKVYKCTCGEQRKESVEKTSHKLGAWKVIRKSTVNMEGLERRYCANCSYYNDRSIAKLKAKYYITLNLGDGKTSKVGVAEDGKYTLETPKKVGYNFKGWQTSAGKAFAASGTVTSNVTVSAVWELDGTDTFAELVERTDAGVDTILITKDITVTDTLFIAGETKIYSDGNYTLKRDPNFASDIFVVGKNREGKISTILGKQAILNLGGGKGTLIIDGNRDNLKTTVVGSAVFVANSGTFNLYDGAEINNNMKLGNKRVMDYTDASGVSTLERTGGAAVAIIRATVNMYGGAMKNNIVATEYTVIPNEETGTDISYEIAGCGGAVYNNGNFNMTGGVISGNEALRGGGVYTTTYVYLDAGTIAENISHTYGGAISSSSGSNADIHLGTSDGDKVMLIKDNYSMRAGGAIYSNTSSPIVIYGNTEFIGNHTDSSGGAIYTAGPLTIRGTRFEGNSCVYSGGAIYNHYSNASYDRRYFTVSDSDFVENNAGLGGAVILSAADAVADKNMGTFATITNCNFTKNQALKSDVSAGNGGAIYITRKSDATISNCKFTENSASGNAGAVAIHNGSKVTIPGCTFTGNSAAFGGAMYASSEAVVKLSDAVISDNSAVLTETGGGGLGGGIYVSLADLTLQNVDLYRNSAGANGGAICQSNIELNIDSSCEFIGNSAAGHGGAFYLTYRTLEDGTLDGAVLNADGVLFKDNTAMAGGAISIRSAGHANLNNVKLINNSATGTGNNPMGGGAVYVGYGSLNLTDVTATGNSSVDYGGAVNSAGSDVVITRGEFSNNTALNGGAFSATSSSNLAFTETKLTSNESTYVQTGSYNSSLGGGAINISGGSLGLDTVTIDGNKSNYYGGAVLASKTEVTIKNSTVKNSQGATGAALYFKNSCNATITDTAVTDNTSTANGVLYASSGTLDMTNVTATGNTASSGGVIYFTGSSTIVNLNDSVWSGNSAISSGGAVYFRDGTFNVNNCQINSNSSKLGGAFYSEKGAVNVKNVAFTENTATQNGGAIDIVGTVANISENTTFTNNSAVSHGGAVYVNYVKKVAATETTPEVPAVYGKLTVDGGKFESNKAMAGAAVSARTGSETTFNGTAFTTNIAEGHDGKADGDGDGGGAIYVGFGKVNLNNVTATGNEVKESVYVNDKQEEKLYGFGGFINGYQAEIYIDGSTITGSKAPSGGAINIVGSNNILSINKSNFINNESTYLNKDYDNTKGGGAINVSNATVTMNEATFDGNKSGWYGGAVILSKCNATIDKSNFTNSNGATGAALNIKVGSDVTITDTEIKNNTSTYNGVVYANSSTVTMNNVTAKGNKAVNGGVLYTSNGNTVIDMTDCDFAENTATSGGVAFTENATLKFNECTVSGNSATGNGGVVFSKEGSAKIEFNSCEISSNSAKSGGVVYTEPGASVDVSNTVFTENTATSNGGAIYVNEAAEFTVDGSTFSKNYSKSNGGAIYVSRTPLTLTDSTFTENSTDSNGGAINNIGAVITASGNNTFTSNTAKNHAGAIYVTYIGKVEATETTPEIPAVPGVVNMTGGIFENNSALGGGAVSIRSGCEATLTDTVLTGNTVEGYADKNDGNGEGGGAIYVGYGKVTLNNVTATGNESKATVYVNEDGKDKLYSFGGVVDAAGATVTVAGGTFSGNKAAVGGAFYGTDNTTLSITGAELKENESTYDNSDYDSSCGGGAINMSGGTLTLDSTVLDGNVTDYYGGAVHALGTTVNISNNSVFKNNVGGTGGALYCSSYSKVTMSDSSVLGNTSDYNGVVFVNGTSEFTNLTVADNSGVFGTLYVSGGTSTISESTFENNTVSSTGGAIYHKLGKLTVDSCTFKNNSAKNGGAIYSVENGKLTVTNSEFTENETTTNGGAVYVNEAAEFTVDGSTFSKNYSKSNGGAIYVSRTPLTLTDSTFTENSTDSNGGAINNIGAVITASGNNTFTSNTAKNHAGAIYVTYIGKVEATETTPEIPAVPGVVNMTGGIFESNSALGGGAVSIRTGCEATLTDTVLTGNTVEGYADKNDGDGEGGGAIYVGYGKVTLNNVTATGNEAKASSYTVDGAEKLYGYGGVIDAYKSTVVVAGGTFSENIAPSGGVIYALNSNSVSFTGSTLKDNESNYDVDVSGYTNSCGGGAINVVGTPLTLSGTTLDGNKSGYYGGTLTANSSAVTINNQSVIKNSDGATGSALLFINSSSLVMENSSVTNNVASTNGSGVVYFSSGSSGTLTNVTVSGNENNNGGVLYVSGSGNVTVENSEFTSNKARNNGGAIYFLSTGKLTVKNTSFTGNSSTKNGGAIFVSGKTTAEITDCSFKSNTSATAGALSADKGAKVTVTGGNFEGNQATGGDGGAILVADSSDKDTKDDTTDVGEAATTLILTNVGFTSNTASGKGGAISTDDKSPNLVIKATGCTFTSNSSTDAGAGAVEIMNGNQTNATDPTELAIVFTNCTFTNNTAKTTGGAVEIRTSSVAKFDGITATGNVAVQNGGVIYVTSNYSRVYITGDVVSSNNSANGSVAKGTLVHLYTTTSYTNPPTLYTTAAEGTAWLSQVNGTSIVCGLTQMP